VAGVSTPNTEAETVRDEIVSLRYVARLLESHEQLTDAERDEIGSVAGTPRAWVNQWDQWRKQGRAA